MNKVYKLYPMRPALRINALCTAFSVEHGADFSYEGESHDFYEAVFILQGEAGITAGDEVLCLHAGHMLIHPPMEFHRIWNCADTSLRFLIFSFGAESFPQMDGHRVAVFTPKQGEDIEKQIEILREHFETDGNRLINPKSEHSRAPIQQAVNRIEILLLSLMQNETMAESDGTRSAKRYTDVVTLMQRYLDRRLSVDELVVMTNMSRSALQKMFYRYAGMGVIKFYTRLQVMRAQDLLESGMSVKETALALGFDDQNYFSRLFRRFTGKPPSAFRSKR